MSCGNSFKIASVGDNCVDIYVNADNAVYVGGNAVNTAVAIRRSGTDCSYVGMVGDDEHGSRVASELAAEGIDVSHLRAVHGKTAYTKILLENNDRIPVDEDIGVQRKYNLDQTELEYVLTHDFCHFTAFTSWPSAYEGELENYYDVIPAIVRRLHERNVRLSMDFTDVPMDKLLLLCRDQVELGFFSRACLSDTEICEEAKRLFRYGFKCVVLTRGSKGSCSYNGRDFVFQPIIPVEVVDPLGAGDSFAGAFLSAYLQGQTLEECLEKAAEYAAQVCTRFGGF